MEVDDALDGFLLLLVLQVGEQLVGVLLDALKLLVEVVDCISEIAKVVSGGGEIGLELVEQVLQIRLA